jgi:hypothetical protein
MARCVNGAALQKAPTSAIAALLYRRNSLSNVHRADTTKVDPRPPPPHPDSRCLRTTSTFNRLYRPLIFFFFFYRQKSKGLFETSNEKHLTAVTSSVV